MDDVHSAALSARSISKYYPGVRALSEVDLTVAPGEIHGIVGENGAGKSTLMAVVSGAVRPDRGSVEIGGAPLAPPIPDRARELGVAIVRQEPALLPDLSVAENLYLKVPERRRPRPADARRWAQECLDAWNPALRIGVDLRVEQLSAEERFIVDIAAALASEPAVLILDEPTEHLGREDVERLFELIRRVAGTGCAVVYITHRIHEVRAICQNLTVLRDGETRGTVGAQELSESDVVTLIVGRDLDTAFPEKFDAYGDPDAAPRLSLRGFSGPGFVALDLDVRPGEIIGLAGIEGNGQRDVLRALAGLKRSSGVVRVDGETVSVRSRRAGLRGGMGFLPGDRHREGILPELSVAENIELRNLPAVSAGGFVVPRRARELVRQAMESLDVKAPAPEVAMGSLSGGNQQKAMLSSLLESSPRVILVDEPTQGVDVGAKMEIYAQLRRMARAEGLAMIVVSSDAFELAGLCDRVLVFSRGSVVTTPDGDELTESTITGAVLTASTQRERHGGAGRRFSWLSGDVAPIVLIAAAVLAIAVASAMRNPFYLSGFTIATLLTTLIPLAAVALGQTTVMMVGGIDLSVGPLMGFLVVVASFFLTADAGVLMQGSGWLLLIVIAAAVGVVNWVLTEILGLPALVATLATYFALQAASLLLRPSPGGLIDPSIMGAISSRLAGVIPVALLVLVAVAVLLQWALRRTPVGIQLRGIGSDPANAALMGARPSLLRLGAYVACSLLALLGALAIMSQVGTGDPAIGSDYTLTSISAAVIGGASLFGGRGTYLGTLLGALLVQQVISSIPFLGLPQEWQYFSVGLLTLGAVALFSKFRQLSKAGT